MKIWVTKNNHDWAAEITGLPLDEIKLRYEEAHKQKIICTIEVADCYEPKHSDILLDNWQNKKEK